MNQRIVYRYLDMAGIVAFALQTLRELSPVGSPPGDKHPGLYRDSHTVFLNGHVVKDVSGFRDGDQIDISNPVPWSRKIEGGMSVPGHVYEQTAQLVNARFGNSVSCKFVFMPVRFGDVAAWAAFTKLMKKDRKRMNEKSRQDWLVRQPALEIRSR